MFLAGLQTEVVMREQQSQQMEHTSAKDCDDLDATVHIDDDASVEYLYEVPTTTSEENDSRVDDHTDERVEA